MKSSSDQKNTVIVVGLLFVLTGLVFNEWMLASLFSPDGTIAFNRRLIIWFFDLVMVAIGIAIITKRKSLNAQRFLYILITLILILFVMEIGLHIMKFVVHFGEAEEIGGEKLYLLSPYEGKEWAKQLFKEQDEVPGGTKEYRGWGKNEYHGDYINIDLEGVRKTWNPEEFNGVDPETIYMFGASTVWGFGARDDHTLPSYMSKKLNSKGYNFKISNRGEIAYSFTQQIIYLTLLLKDGHRPDYVIFYGWMDIYNAYRAGKPGILHWTHVNKLQPKQLTDLQNVRLAISNILKKYSIIYKEVMKWNRKLAPIESPFNEVAHTFSEDELQELVNGTVEYYSKTYELLDNLSKIYSFKYISFWMPIIYTEEELTEEEKTVDIRSNDEGMNKMYRLANEAFKTNSFPRLYNVTDVLKGRTKTYYIDSGHLSEEGNEVVAARLAAIFEKEYLLKEDLLNE
jgi:lysophospholipase L1-like esterase